MTQENPPVIENNEEATVEQLDLMQERTVAVDPKEMEKLDDLNREIAFRTSETAEAIREGQRKKGNEIERFDPTPVSTYEIPNKQAPTNRIKNWADRKSVV